MRLLRTSLFTVVMLNISLVNVASAIFAAKSYPGDSSYPSADAWAKLNRTVNGNLIIPRLKNTGLFERIAVVGNATAPAVCGIPKSGFEKDPALIKSSWWAGYGCLDCPARYAVTTCSLGNYPHYVVKVMSAQDVATVVQFANEWNLRLVVKNTGHDFLGRNLGYGSLSIWTYHLRGIKWDEKWTPTGTTGPPQSAVIYSAGEPWKNIYSGAYTHRKIVTGGTSGSVGAGGGWVMGGGHGFFTNRFGLGVDNVLEFQVVLPTGTIVIANSRSNIDLFWALRGGGGSTFGIVTRVTMKAHPSESLHGVVVSVVPAKAGANENYVRGMAYLLSSMPAWTDFGLTGHPIVYATKFNSLFTAPGKTPAEISAFLATYTAELQRLGCKVTVSTVSDGQNARLISLDLAKNAGISELHEGDPYVMGSRLLGREGLKDRDGLERVLTQLFAKNYVLEPFNVGGGAVAANRDLDIGLNPAWRDAIIHFQIVPLAQAGPKTVGQIYRMAQDTLKDVGLFDEFSVQSAAYVNEVSYLEPEWQKVMWGSNYPKLLSVKRKYDPNNTLWCFPCVGSEVMRVGPDGKLYDRLFQDKRRKLIDD